MSQSDNEKTIKLLADVEKGDSFALQELLALHRPYLTRVVQIRIDPMLAARIDPSDVVQEAQVVIFKRMEDYLRRRPTSFRLWIRNHVMQCLVDQYRRHVKYQKRSVLREKKMCDASSMAIAKRLVSETPSRHAQRAELREQIQQAIGELSEMDREILGLRHAERLSNNEAAELLKLSPNTVRQRYGRALRRLHQVINQRQIDIDGTFE